MTARDRRPPAPTATIPSSSPVSGRPQLIADTAIRLLAERGMRGLTHRAVDEAAGLPLGSTSNLARTREALLETAVRRLAEREAAVLTPTETPTGRPAHTTGPEESAAGTEATGTGPEVTGTDPEGLADALSLALHRYLSGHRQLLLARYELALEATRRPALREIYDRAGRAFREPMVAMLAAAGSAAPERHALTMVAWCDGVLFSCTAGQFHTSTPTRAELRTSCAELLTGMLRPHGPGR